MEQLGKKIKLLSLLSVLFLWACGEETSTSSSSQSTESEGPAKPVFVPDFNADSAYYFIQKQVEFGPRVPNTPEHRAAGDFLADQLAAYGGKVKSQRGEVTAYDGTMLQMRNIMATFYPEKTRKVLLCAHWDTRPFADQDDENQKEPIAGANDGGSGVGVILEIARLLQENEPELGVEIILFDAEDYGRPSFEPVGSYEGNTYCLGSQYWAERMSPSKYFADFGILLDMVGAKDAVFKQEEYSRKYAPAVVKKVWGTAHRIGHDRYFSKSHTGPVVDDHIYVNQAGIPCVNIIQFDSHATNAFGDFWHTHQDDMGIIDKNTLKAVGETVMTVIFEAR